MGRILNYLNEYIGTSHDQMELWTLRGIDLKLL